MDAARVLFVFGIVLSTSAVSAWDQLIPEIVGDILSILVNGTVHLLGNCTGSENAAPETAYWIYTSDNADDPQVTTTPSETTCGGRTRIIFLNHGWGGDPTKPYVSVIKDAYLTRYSEEVCVIAIDWSSYASGNYQSAYCAGRGVATNIANFVCSLTEILDVDIETVHLVGHSLGAQIFGISGGLIQETCGSTVGRITGLDPAGPLFEAIAKRDRLDASDALFVDVLHTNLGQMGYAGRCGDLDVYPNCGLLQPGCVEFILRDVALANLTDILGVSYNYLRCNHQMSCWFFAESIASGSFLARGCDLCGLPVCFEDLGSDAIVVGEDASPESSGGYVLYTNKEAPYAKG